MRNQKIETFLTIFLAIIVCLITLILLLKNFTSILQRKTSLRCPRGYPIIGNAFDLLPNNCIEAFDRYTKLYGGIYELYAIFQRFIIISDLKLITDILSKRPKTFRRSRLFIKNADFFELQSGLFHAEGKTWNRMRRIAAPSFNKKNTNNMFLSLRKEVDNLIASLFFNINDDNEIAIDMKDELIFFTIKVMSEVAFGGNSLTTQTAKEYMKSKQLVFDLNTIANFSVQQLLFPFPWWIWRLTSYYNIYEKPAIAANERINSVCLDIIRQKRLSTTKISDQSSSLLDTLLRQSVDLENDNANNNNDDTSNGLGVTDSELLASVKTFFIAGSDTTSIAMTWTLFYLSQDSEFTKLLQEEVDNIDLTDPSCLDLFILTKSAVKEAIRLSSPASNLFMQTTDSRCCYTLPDGNVIYPNDQIIINIDNRLWDPNIFPDPKKFFPQRWLTTTTNSSLLQEMESNFIAFGSGARKCPGMGLALDLEAPLGIASIVKNFNFKLACDPKEIKRTKHDANDF